MTLSITALRRMTFSIMKLSITTLKRMKLSKMKLSIMKLKHYDIQHNDNDTQHNDI